MALRTKMCMPNAFVIFPYMYEFMYVSLTWWKLKKYQVITLMRCFYRGGSNNACPQRCMVPILNKKLGRWIYRVPSIPWIGPHLQIIFQKSDIQCPRY